MEVHLCEAGRVPAGLSEIQVDGTRYLLSRDAAGIHVFSAVCPHQGGAVACDGDGFRCPIHFWSFDALGQSQNVRDRPLHEFRTTIRDGWLIADVDHFATSPHLQGRSLETGLDIRLHAHACAEFVHSGRSILTDPWLAGPAFNGAWTQYPPPTVRGEDLSPDVVIITHEHSDHFHPETLATLGDVPILYPDFPNRRIGRILDDHCIRNHRACPFGEPVEAAGARVTFYEPASLWNDSIVLFEFPDCTILNVNDAGLNERLRHHLPQVDIVMASFNAGASGYPMTWEHFDVEEKRAFYERAKRGQLEQLKQIARSYGAQLVLPFASFFALWHPSHRDYVPLLVRNSPLDVRHAFEGTGIGVIDILPGECWHGRTGTFTRRYPATRAASLFTPDAIARHVAGAFDPATFARFHPVDGTVPDDAVIAYFDRFNDSPLLAGCETLTLRLEIEASDGAERALHFAVAPAGVHVLDGDPDWNLRIRIPEPLLARVIDLDLSWDEVHIGYWLRFSRRPNVFNAGFWRMLQAPYYRKRALAEPIAGDMVLDRLLVDHPEVDPILRRFGLYCSMCGKRPLETVHQAARFHGLPEDQERRLLEELEAVRGAAP